MARPGVLVLTGYGINCEEETAFGFDYAGGDSSIVHINDLIERPGILDEHQVFVFPGGFSYGDDTGSGKALANRIRNNLLDELTRFVERDTLVLGICNGFQVMVNTGILPGPRSDEWTPRVALEHNASFVYQCRWVDLEINPDSSCVFTRGIDYLHIPVAHGEGNFFAPDDVLNELEGENRVTMRYARSDGSRANGEFPWNPNGSLKDIASICDETGRIMGMMPHPERGMFFHQRDDWTLLRDSRRGEPREKGMPVEAGGMRILRNAVEYFA
jgi:phosphoribosylformylglycinamidine synthase